MRMSRVPALALVTVLAACGEDPAGPADPAAAFLNLDVATAAADAVAEDLRAMATIVAAPASDTRSDGTRTVTRSIVFFNAEGGEQDGYDPLTTAIIKLEVTAEGSAQRGPWSVEWFRTRHLEVSGLAGEETTRTVNGGGEEELTRERHTGDSPPRSYHLTGEFSIVNVVLPVPGDGVEPWPLSGTVTREYTVVRGDHEPVTRTVIAIFNGTSTPTATVNGEPFELDLRERTARRR